MEHGAPLPRTVTQGEARTMDFERHAKQAKELAALSLAEIDEAMITNQINMAGCEVVDSLGTFDES